MRALFLFSVPYISTLAACHGTPDTPKSVLFRNTHLANVARSMSQCSDKMRSAAALERHLSKRDTSIGQYFPLGDRAPTGQALLSQVGLHEYFSASKCVLTPEGQEGPFYVDGATVRKDIRDDQAGVPMLLDVQVTDARTCAPIADVMVDFWGCNSTGFYSGFEREGTGGLAFLRGLQKTDGNGIAQVITTFPGWYPGRAQHIHVKAHTNYTLHTNNTITSGAIVHTGQLFFHQSNLSQINKLYPYTLDSHRFTPNANDRDIQQILDNSEYDPFVALRLIGANLTVGVSGFIELVIDPSVEPPLQRPGGPGRKPPKHHPGKPPGDTPPGNSVSDSAAETRERVGMDCPKDVGLSWMDIKWYEGD